MQLRFAPPIDAMRAFIEPHRDWLESVLGCPLSEALTFEVSAPFGQLVLEDLLAGVGLDRECLQEAELLRPAVSRWALPPGASPRIDLNPSRNRQALVTTREPAWDPHWMDTPVAVWFHGLTHAVVAVDIPYISFAQGLFSRWNPWLLVNRAGVSAALSRLTGFLAEPRKRVTVIGGRDIPLARAGYDWEGVVLDPGLTRLVRDDFENFLQREEWFKRHRLPFRRGYLFYGPPGNGKTQTVRIMASHPEMSAYSLDFSNTDLQNDALTELFESAGRMAPSVVIFEDLDRLYGKAVGTDNLTRITLQHLLNCLDGLGSQDGVIVVATANDPTALDPAILRRPGRFDRVVPFPPPAFTLRQQYLRQLSARSLDEPTLAAAAREADGFSFVQLRESYILAGQLAFRRGDDDICTQDLMEGIRLVRLETQTARSRIDGQSVGFGLLAGETPATRSLRS